jgi:hypothetical protein
LSADKSTDLPKFLDFLKSALTLTKDLKGSNKPRMIGLIVYVALVAIIWLGFQANDPSIYVPGFVILLITALLVVIFFGGGGKYAVLAVIVGFLVILGFLLNRPSPTMLESDLYFQDQKPAVGYTIGIRGGKCRTVSDGNGHFTLDVNPETEVHDKSVFLQITNTSLTYAEEVEVANFKINKTYIPPHGVLLPRTESEVRAAIAAQPQVEHPQTNVGPLVTVTDTPLDFNPRSEYQYLDERGGGCRCSKDNTIAFPDVQYNVRVNEEFLFRYDGSQVCRKQAFKNFQGKVNWSTVSTSDLHDFQPWSYWAIAGTLKVKFDTAGDYDANTTLSVDCIDAGAQCTNRCGAAGRIHIRVTE